MKGACDKRPYNWTGFGLLIPFSVAVAILGRYRGEMRELLWVGGGCGATVADLRLLKSGQPFGRDQAKLVQAFLRIVQK